MKKKLLMIVTVCTMIMCACVEKQNTYTYKEPEENIAKQIWDLLTLEDPKVQPVIAVANDFDYYTQEECTISKSNTELKYDYVIPQGFAEDDNYLAALYELKCYQKLDNTWIALVLKNVHGYGLDEKDCGQDFYAVHYDGEKTTPCELETIAPEAYRFIQANVNSGYISLYDNLSFENTAFRISNSTFWPIMYNWNGKVFNQDPESLMLQSTVDLYRGDFSYYESGNYYGFDIGQYRDYLLSMKGDNLIDSKGNVLAHLECNDGIVEGYTLESPSCGVAQQVDYISDKYIYIIKSKPIALGYPIQNVLDYQKGYWMKDTVVSQGMSDGKYVITQQLAHDKINGKRDVYIEYIAKDEHSNIEKIHVYSHPITLIFEEEVNDSKDLADHVKTIFNELNYDFKTPSFGAFWFFLSDSYSKNGFDAHFTGEVQSIRLQTYDAGDKTLVVLAQYGEDEVFVNSDKLLNLQAWYYENGQFTETALDLPKPLPEDFAAYSINDDTTIDPEHYTLSFDDQGIQYYAFSDRNDGAVMRDEDGIFINPDFYTIQYLWNGKQFE